MGRRQRRLRCEEAGGQAGGEGASGGVVSGEGEFIEGQSRCGECEQDFRWSTAWARRGGALGGMEKRGWVSERGQGFFNCSRRSRAISASGVLLNLDLRRISRR